MDIDRKALESMESDQNEPPLLRFFQWASPAVSYGYLLDPEKVKDFARKNGNFPIVKRPTGGGAVVHQTTDLSISLLWPRRQGIFPDKPRECYKAIHKLLIDCFGKMNHSTPNFQLWVASCGATRETWSGTRRNPKQTVPVCFEEPVCDDVMLNGEKIIGGALRLTRKAILYQGNIQWDREIPRSAILLAFSFIFNSSQRSSTS